MENKRNKLRITEILSRSFNLCTNNFLEILKVIGLFIVPATMIPLIIGITLAVSTFLRISMNSYSNFESVGIGTILLIITTSTIFAIISLFATLVITKMLDDANKGNEVRWKIAIKYVWSRIWSAIGLNILVWLMVFGAMLVIIFLGLILSLLTLGIGAIIVIPFVIAIMVILSPFIKLFNSTFIVNELGVSDSIRETFLLFKRGYFWSTIGKLAAISGIYIGITILLWMFELLPIIGFIITILGQLIIDAYVICYINILVLDRNNLRFDSLIENTENNNSGDNFIDPII